MLVKTTCEFYEDTYSTKNIYVDSAKQCPRCHTSNNGEVIYAIALSPGSRISAIHFCSVCGKFFFAEYYIEDIHDSTYHLGGVYPDSEFKPTEFSERIRKLSPDFVSIYNQAAQAEELNLHDICGLGYRRATEYLVKDFVISRNPENKDEILKCSLAKCISEYVENDNVKRVASRVAWLGNDHAHCVVKHTNRDLNDLKALVSLTVKWVDMELETEEFTASIHPIR